MNTYRLDHPHYFELNSVQRDRLDEAAAGHYADSAGIHRYAFYRRRGYSVADSLAYALAWLRNSVEQAERRISHETGAEPPRWWAKRA